MSLLNKFLFFFIILFISFGFSSEVSLNTYVDKTKIYIGDEINYNIVIKYPDDFKILPLTLSDKLGLFEIKDFDQIDKKLKKNLIEKKLSFVLSGFITGEFIIPSFQIYYIDNKGVTNSLKTDEIKITIESLTSSQMTNMDIRDLKPQLKIKDKYLSLKILLFFIFLLGLFFIFYFKKYYKKEEGEIKIIKKPEIPADVEAKQKLDEVVNSDLLKEKKIKEYYSRINEIIRYYLYRRFNIITLEKTSYEIMEELSKLYIDKKVFEKIDSFLEKSDMVKFAKYKPTSNEISGFTNMAYEIVKETRISDNEVKAE